MWIASYQNALLKKTRQTSTSTTLPSRIVMPLGRVHPAVRSDDRRTCRRLRRARPAARSRSAPTAAAGSSRRCRSRRRSPRGRRRFPRPRTGSRTPRRSGPSAPARADPSRTTAPCPDTAPTANSTAATFDQRCASTSASASSRRSARQLAIIVMKVNATPNGTRMMWKPSVNAICSRAGSSCDGSPAASAFSAIRAIRTGALRSASHILSTPSTSQSVCCPDGQRT